MARQKAVEQGLDPDQIDDQDEKLGDLFDKADSNNGDEDTVYMGKAKPKLDDSVAAERPGERTSLLD